MWFPFLRKRSAPNNYSDTTAEEMLKLRISDGKNLFMPLATDPTYPHHEPVDAGFLSTNLSIAGGVAVFHLASARVVLCYHTKHEFWFLPKGRRDTGEDSRQGAEREGFEESGYRNRLLPLPIPHR